MAASANLGAWLLPARLSAAYVCDGRLYTLPKAIVGPGPGRQWLRVDASGYDYFSPRDLIGVQTNGRAAAGLVFDALRALVEGVDDANVVFKSMTVAVPSSFEDFQRSHLIHQLSQSGLPIRLVDSSAAVLRQLLSDENKAIQGTWAIIIADDAPLQIALAQATSEGGSILGSQLCAGLSGRCFDHFLLERAIASLSQQALGSAPVLGLESVDGFLDRLNGSRSRLARLPEVRLPVRGADSNEAFVTLRQTDVRDFFNQHFPELSHAIGSLLKQTGIEKVDRVVLVGSFGEFYDFTQQIEKLLGPLEVLPDSVIAEGAALIAPGAEAGGAASSPPLPLPLAQYLKQHAQPIEFPKVAASQTELQQKIRDVLECIDAARSSLSAQALAQILQGLMSALQQTLGELGIARPLEGSENFQPGAVSPANRPQHAALPKEEVAAVVHQESNTPPPRSARYLRDAERLLAAGKVLEAVGLSHQAHNAAPENHPTLMAMLDLHRRGAAMLKGPEQFKVAIQQLHCALDHSFQDKLTQQALADRYLEQASFLRESHRLDEATKLLEQAIPFVEDETQIKQMLDQLDREQGQ
jgi:tetratricopeptide (TPR) repeat protein